jgi:hypothetical protein
MMYKKWTAMEVQDWGDRWQVVYAVEHVPEPGDPDQTAWAEQSGHCFPKDVFEWRAAEYGIDPTDMDTLLDVVLAEPFLSPADYARRESLHDAPDIETARAAHLRRCAQGKLRSRVSTRSLRARGKETAPDPLAVLRTESLMNSEAMVLKARMVSRMRQEYADRVEEPRTEEQRVKKLREQLNPRETRG